VDSASARAGSLFGRDAPRLHRRELTRGGT
jgi:hypothetical protein